MENFDMKYILKRDPKLILDNAIAYAAKVKSKSGDRATRILETARIIVGGSDDNTWAETARELRQNGL